MNFTLKYENTISLSKDKVGSIFPEVGVVGSPVAVVEPQYNSTIRLDNDFRATMGDYEMKIMKSKKELIILFFLLIFKVGIAQVTPIETVIDTKKTTYKTSQHDAKKSIVKSQSYELRQKIQENIKISDTTTHSLFVKDCLTATSYTTLKRNKVFFSIEYI